jgi:crotonobetainyl-CoA hydratase
MRATRNLEIEHGFTEMRSGAIASYQRAIQSEDASEGSRAFADGPRWQGR